jgi:hypothetical protein
MTPETPTSATEELAEAQEPKQTSVVWQLVQIAVLAGLLLAGMYEVDLDAKALAEKRGRTALLLAVEVAAERTPSASGTPELERAIESYAKVCAECAASKRCEETIRSIRVEKTMPAGRGPCRVGIFERWSADETAGSPRAP